ncbi:MAG: ATP-binding cassette domain-containing protein [Oscillospiraceae bacterium]
MPIELDNVSFVYAKDTPFEAEALKNISLSIKNGEFVGVMGHTGCGKSTLIELMVGLLAPAKGRVLLDGRNINSRVYDRRELRRKVGIVFQYPEYQLFETTVERDVLFGLKRLGLTKSEATERVKWALGAVVFDYDDVRSVSPLALSGGEKRRVAIAGVLAVRPEVLVLDEPIAGLDPLGRESFLRLMDSLNASGTTIIMVSHNADALAEHAGRIIALENGGLVMDGNAGIVLGDVRNLKARRLGISQPAIIAELLREKGVELGRDVIRYDELVSRLVMRFKGGGADL